MGDELGDWAIWSVIEQSSKQIGIEHFGAHDPRRICAKLAARAVAISSRSIFCLVTHQSRPRSGIRLHQASVCSRRVSQTPTFAHCATRRQAGLLWGRWIFKAVGQIIDDKAPG